MEKKLLVVVVSMFVIATGAAGYMYYQYTQPLPDPKYQGTVTYRECSAVELSMWCGRIYLDTGGENYALRGDAVSQELVGKKVELHGEAIETMDGYQVIEVRRIRER